MRKCKWCGSEFVCWNWLSSPFWKIWWINLCCGNRNAWKRPWIFLDRWSHECWDCGHMISTFLKVQNGIPYEDLKTKFIHLPKHTVREAIEEVWWIIDQSKYFSEKERYKFDRRVKSALDMFTEAFREQWKLDNPVRPIYDEETENKYKNHLHSVSILKAIEVD